MTTVPSRCAAPSTPSLAARSWPERRGMVGTGERLQSRSGRAMAPVPRLAMGSGRVTLNTLVRLNGWLIDEARAEASAQGNAFHTTLLKGMNPKKLSPSDLDTLNLMLFDHEDGPGPEHRLPTTASGTALAA